MWYNMRRIVIAVLLLSSLVSGAVAFEWLPEGLVTDGLVAAYDFQQGDTPTILYDISGNGHHGTIIGGATWTDEGLQFDGTNDYVNLGDLGSLGDGYTIVAVTKAHTDHWEALLNRISSTNTQSQNGYGLLLMKEPTADDRWSMKQYEDPELSELSRLRTTSQTSPGSTNRWTVLCAQYGDGLLSLGVDDIPPSRATIDTSFREHTGNYYLGRLSYTSAYYYNGSIAYLAVYDRKLTPAELDQVNRHVQAAMADRGIQVAVYIPMPPMVVFTMDDGVETDYTNAYRLAKERGIPLVSYINTNNIGKAGRLTWDQIREMRAAGFAIECHTHTHVDVTSLTEAELRATLEAVNAAFVAAGLPAPEHHSYPFGRSDEASRAIVAEYRETARTINSSSGTIVDEWVCGKPGWTGWDRLRAWNVYRDATGNVDDVKAKIDDAILKNQAVIFYTHDISDSPSAQGLHADLFEEILDYIAAKRDAGLIEPVTIDGLYRAIEGIRTHPATGPMTLHGETTGATYNSTVDYVGFVWGTTRHNNPEGTAPDASGYDNHWISSSGDYAEAEFSYVVASYTPSIEYYYRSAAKIDGTWYYGEELTYTTPGSRPYVTFTYTADGDETRTGTPIHFQSTISGNATSWQWDFKDGATSTERNPTHTFTRTGTYHVTLTATNIYGSSSFSHTFRVYSGTVSPPTRPPTPPPTTWPYPLDPTPTPPLSGSAFRWDPETGYYTSYWFNRDGGFIDVHGLFFSLMLPLTALIGQWFFLIIWGTLVMGMYLHSQDTTLPFVIGILLGAVISLSAGADGVTVMYLTMAFAGGGVLAKVLLGRL